MGYERHPLAVEEDVPASLRREEWGEEFEVGRFVIGESVTEVGGE